MSRADQLTAEDVVGNTGFAERGYPHDAWRILREEAPLRFFDLSPRPGFGAVVRRADIVWLSPNLHLGFGIGEHFCLGASLARPEMRVALEKLIPRLESIELAGDFERMRSSFLGGVKRMPIRYSIRD